MKSEASVVIIGGGIVGCSIAYHLTLKGCSNVVVLEKGELTSGSTWHAAGLVGQLRSSRNITHMLTLSVKLYSRLEKETDQPTGWRQVGGLRIASSEDRMLELKRAATTAKSFGLEMHLLSPKEAYDLFPIMDLKGIVGASFLPTDGYTDPTMTTQALAKGARSRGAVFERGVRVLEITKEGREAKVVRTDKGDIKADIVVNAAGMWSREIGQMVGVNVPAIPVEHQYIVTDPIEGMPRGLPTMRDPDNLVYYKEEMGGLVMGGYEPNPKAWPVNWPENKIPRDFDQKLLSEDFDHFQQIADKALLRTPILAKAGIRKLINGPEAFTPDGNFILGKAPEMDNFFVAAGFNAHGIAGGGGVGQMMAEWILDGRPSLDLWSLDIRRFGEHHKQTTFSIPRTLELYGRHYTISWPFEEHHSARPVYKSPLYETLKAKGASFGSKFGWERPNWFSNKPTTEKDLETFGRPSFYSDVAREHLAIRNGVALIDQTSFSKFEVRGKDAYAFLQYMSDNDLQWKEGKLTYTQLCNERGGIEADLTIAGLAADHFYIVTGTAFGTHDFAWLRDNLPKGKDITLRDVTQERGVLNLCGPLSRKVLERATPDAVTNEAFPFGFCRKIKIAGCEVLALRVTYVGELGWELHVPIANLKTVYETLNQHGKEFGIIDAGYYAIESCRLEKGYRYWSRDLSPDYTPYEAGLGFCVALQKESFLGRDALERQKKSGITRKFSCFTLEKPVQLYGGETILSNDRVVGVVASGGYGFYLEKTIAYGYIPYSPSEKTSSATYAIEVMGERIPAKLESTVLYDPKRVKILA